MCNLNQPPCLHNTSVPTYYTKSVTSHFPLSHVEAIWYIYNLWLARYRQVSNVRCTKLQHLKDSRTVLYSHGCLCRIPWSQMLSQEWRCSWSSANRRCSNYIWVIDNFIAYWGTFCIGGFTVYAVLVVTTLVQLTQQNQSELLNNRNAVSEWVSVSSFFRQR